jgi:hypothetical protein
MQLKIKPKRLVIALALSLIIWLWLGAMVLGWCYAVPGSCG